MEQQFRKPDFMIIGAQKAATTWLWNVLNSHPGTDLPHTKEIHYFGGVENYNKGKDWYYDYFKNLDKTKLTGEASTSYLYDYIPYWDNASNSIEVNHSLPSIPELITTELPNIKVFVVLRDPVLRAISAYKHNMRKANKKNIEVRVDLKSISTHHPKFRILEYGYYARFLRLWKQFLKPEQLRILIYEEDILKSPTQTISDVYKFLGLDETYNPPELNSIVNKSWSWTRILVNYHSKQYLGKFVKSKLGRIFDKFDVFASHATNKEDVEFLRALYLSQHKELEEVIGRKITSWNYGR